MFPSEQMNLFILVVISGSNVFLSLLVFIFMECFLHFKPVQKLEIEVKWCLNIFLSRKVFFHHLRYVISTGNEVDMCNLTCSVSFDQMFAL